MEPALQEMTVGVHMLPVDGSSARSGRPRRRDASGVDARLAEMPEQPVRHAEDHQQETDGEFQGAPRAQRQALNRRRADQDGQGAREQRHQHVQQAGEPGEGGGPSLAPALGTRHEDERQPVVGNQGVDNRGAAGRQKQQERRAGHAPSTGPEDDRPPVDARRGL